MTELGATVLWQGVPYTVAGYATKGDKVYLLWLVDNAGEVFRVSGKELGQVEA